MWKTPLRTADTTVSCVPDSLLSVAKKRPIVCTRPAVAWGQRRRTRWRAVAVTWEGDEKRIGSFMNMSYSCDNIDKTHEELKKRGVEFEGPPQKQPWGTYAMFKDSEG